jgi:hypothetical protein
MLKELEHYFTSRGWFSGTHTFLTMRLEGGFEAFSGKASETWEYRWVVCTIANDELNVPTIMVKGNAGESLDSVCEKLLQQLKAAADENKN